MNNNMNNNVHNNKIVQIAFIFTVAMMALTTLSHAGNAIFSTTATHQKQWAGTPAPDFKLQDQQGKWHQLKHYQGKWLVLYFYPKDHSPGCTQEANQFKSLYPQFLKNNARVLGVSLDDVASHQKFSAQLALPFPILADQHHQLADQFGLVRNLGIAKIAKRESFLIDPQGNIVYHYSSVNTQTHAALVLVDIEKYAQ